MLRGYVMYVVLVNVTFPNFPTLYFKTVAFYCLAQYCHICTSYKEVAAVIQIYVKIYTVDGGSKSLLIDGRWTVEYILHQVAEKNHVIITPHYAIVEEYPDLYMGTLIITVLLYFCFLSMI